jgi:ArsR family metal-binding transcriptional regulator
MGRIISWVRAKLQGIRLIQILKVLKMNDYEYKLFGFENEYQILNIQTKELYSNTNQNGVIKIRIILEEEEFEQILEKVKNKINDNNN